MVHGTLPSYDIYMYLYKFSSNYFHLLQSYGVEMKRTDECTNTHGCTEDKS